MNILDMIEQGFGCVCGGRAWCSKLSLVGRVPLIVSVGRDDLERWRSGDEPFRLYVYYNIGGNKYKGYVEYVDNRFTDYFNDLDEKIVKLINELFYSAELCDKNLQFIISWGEWLRDVVLEAHSIISMFVDYYDDFHDECGSCTLDYFWDDFDKDDVVSLGCSFDDLFIRAEVGHAVRHFRVVFDRSRRYDIDVWFSDGVISIDVVDSMSLIYNSIVGVLKKRRKEIVKCVNDVLRPFVLELLFP